MLYYFLYPLRDHYTIFNVFKYITFRAVGASVTAFIFCMIFGSMIIALLSRLRAIGPTARAHAPGIHEFYKDKKHVPSMGGVLIVCAIVIANMLWGNFASKYMWIVLAVTLWLGFVGFIDDFVKIRTQHSRGMPAIIKLSGQIMLGIMLGFYLYYEPSYQRSLYFPFVKDYVLYLGVFIIPFIVLVLVGSSNALNITDGLDGLAVGCAIIVAATYAIVSYVSGHTNFASYLNIPYIPQSGELSVFCASVVGAGVGFLWFNSYPATVFMGDTGSLALGGAIGTVAIAVKKELLLVIVGGVFVWEALSVILQVGSYKIRGKRIFRMAPFHHHLQLSGWHEAKVTVRLIIIAFILALIGLSTLKLR